MSAGYQDLLFKLLFFLFLFVNSPKEDNRHQTQLTLVKTEQHFLFQYIIIDS